MVFDMHVLDVILWLMLLFFKNCRDKIQLKAEKDGSESYAALERKAELYEKLAKGELSDEEEKEKYCVNFFSKSLNQSENEESKVEDNSEMTTNESNEDDSLPWLNTSGPGRTGSVADHDEHKRFVRYVIICLVVD